MKSSRKKTGKKKSYRVMWSRPGWPEREAGIFSVEDDRVEEIFERDYKKNQRFSGDKLELLCIIKPEKTKLVATRPATEIKED